MVFARRGVRDLHNFSAEYDWLLHEGEGEGEGQVDGEGGSEGTREERRRPAHSMW